MILSQEKHEEIVKQIHAKIMMDCYQKEIKEVEKYGEENYPVYKELYQVRMILENLSYRKSLSPDVLDHVSSAIDDVKFAVKCLVVDKERLEE